MTGKLVSGATGDNLLEAARLAARTATTYLEEQVSASGKNVRAPDHLLHFKLPFVFAFSDRREAAAQVLWHIERNLTVEVAGYRAPRHDVDQGAYLYQLGWLTWGAAGLGRFDLAREFARAAIKHQDAGGGGGFWAQMEAGLVQTLLSTSSAMSGCAVAGETAAAEEGARFMKSFFNLQRPGSRGFYMTVNQDGELVRELSMDHFLPVDEPCAPAMLATAILGSVWLGRRTGNASHFRLARRYADLILANQCDPTSQPFASKTGWAFLELHQAMPDVILMDYARRIAEHFVEIQDPAGSVRLDPAEAGDAGGVPYGTTLNTTCDWLLSAVALTTRSAGDEP